MKITILSTTYPLRGGIAHFNGLLYNELIKNHDVNVITFKRQYPEFLFPGKSQVESEDTVEKIPSDVIVDSVNPMNWYSVGKKIQKDEPDLIIYKYWMPFFAPCFGLINRIVRNNKKTKSLVICDNVIPHEKRPGDISLTKYFFNTVDYFVLMSESVKKDLLTIKPSAKHKLLFHPVYSNFGEKVDKEEVKKKLNISKSKNILFFGFIRKYKGLDILIEAAAILKNKMDIGIIVAGEFYDDEQKYKDLIKEKNVENQLYLFTDFIPTNEVKYYFSAADVVVLPYKDATQSGIVQIANNFEKPIIATDVGGLGEVIKEGKTGYLVESDNPQKLADAIIKFYDENNEQEFVENVKKELDKFSWQKFTDALIELTKK